MMGIHHAEVKSKTGNTAALIAVIGWLQPGAATRFPILESVQLSFPGARGRYNDYRLTG